jgi:hypothetical protein
MNCYFFGEAQNEPHLYAKLLGCRQGQFPIRYLSISIHYRRLTNAEWKIGGETTIKAK